MTPNRAVKHGCLGGPDIALLLLISGAACEVGAQGIMVPLISGPLWGSIVRLWLMCRKREGSPPFPPCTRPSAHLEALKPHKVGA